MNPVTLSLPVLLLLASALVLLSAVITWLITHLRQQARLQREREAYLNDTGLLKQQLAQQQQQYQYLHSEFIATEQQLNSLQPQFQAAQTALSAAETLNRQLPVLEQTLAQQQQRSDSQQQQLQTLLSQQAAHQQQARHWQQQQAEQQQLQQDYHVLQQQLSQLQVQHERMHTQLQQERLAQEEKLQLLHQARESLSDQFKNLANDILEEKSKRFSEQNQASLNQMLTPLHERMQGFSKLVQETYDKDSKERLTLEHELKRLQQLNSQLHGDAKALTDALNGTQNKSQGNWGEMVLEKVLEHSGLQKGREYQVQATGSHTDDSGQQRRLQPDVLINLPDHKQIIIDAKVSLTAYVRYTQAPDAASADSALKAHLASVRQHIKSLSDKRYHDIEGLVSLDFVLMFVPVEPAYLLALQHDDALYQDSFAQRIMLVGPSTLLATLRTIAHIWRNEQQNQNALTIASEGGKLYDKLVGFVETLDKLGKNLEQSQGHFQAAMNQLSSGRGNLIGRAEKLRRLGIKANKQLAKQYLDDDAESPPDSVDDTPLRLPETGLPPT